MHHISSVCDAPFCENLCVWFVGNKHGKERMLGHGACASHLNDAVIVVAYQLDKRGERIEMHIVPYGAIMDAD